jgi:uncharacterized protein YraI
MKVDDVGTVYVDNQPITASAPFFTGETYTATVQLTQGPHIVQVDMAEFILGASLNVTWTGAETGGGGTCDPAAGGGTKPSPTGVTATVTANVGLNFRECPSLTCTKITKLEKDTTWPVLGRTADSVWAQLDVDGKVGWALAQWLSFTGDFNTVPVTWTEETPGLDSPLPDGVPIRAVGNVRIRECPSLSCARITYVPWGTRVLAYGKTQNGLWLNIGYEDPELGAVIGWSYALWYFNDAFRLPLPELPVIAE